MAAKRRVTPIDAGAVAGATAPYSHALLVDPGRLLFISGQGPVDAAGKVVSQDPRAQVEQVFANIRALVEAAGGSLADIVEITAYVREMRFRDVITDVRRELLRPPYPTATIVAISGLAFDDWLVEVSAVAAL